MRKTFLVLLVGLFLVTGCSSSLDSSTVNSVNVGSNPDGYQGMPNLSMKVHEYTSKYNELIRAQFLTEQKVDQVGDDYYIGSAKKVLEGTLLNPSTAVYNESRVLEKDPYGRAIIHLDVSGQNAFGGYARNDFYVCITKMDKKGNFEYSSTFSQVKEYSSIPVLKIMNQFGLHPMESKIEGVMIPDGTMIADETIHLTKTQDLLMSSFVNEDVVIGIYSDSALGNVSAVTTGVSNYNPTGEEYRETSNGVFRSAIRTLTGMTDKEAGKILARILESKDLIPSNNPAFFQDQLLYEMNKTQNGLELTITAISKSDYKAGFYWTPNTTGTFQTRLIDRYLQEKDYEGTILLMDRLLLNDDRKSQAFYGKAEQLLASNQLSEAAEYFDKVGSYRDAPQRKLEVYYKAALGKLEEKDYASAIDFFGKAMSYQDSAEKLKESNYLLAVQYKELKDYEKAIPHFQNAGNYSDAADQFLESNYLYGEQLLTSGLADEAAVYFKAAAGYQDAAGKIPEYHYLQGKQKAEIKDYQGAILHFETAGDYQDAKDHLIQCNYLLGVELLGQGQADQARPYFDQAAGYKDADTIILAWHYDLASKSLEQKEYESALEQFSEAGDYLDALQKVQQCQYEIGKQQMEQGRVEEGIETLLQCKDYKDANEIILNHYYTRGLAEFDDYLEALNGDYYEAEEFGKAAMTWFDQCEGYKNTNTIIQAMASLERFRIGSFDIETGGSNTLTPFEAELKEGKIHLYIEQYFYSSATTPLELTCSPDMSEFQIKISKIFSNHLRDYEALNRMTFLVGLFTEKFDNQELYAYLEDPDHWTATDQGEKLDIKFDGFKLNFQHKAVDSMHIDAYITGKKLD